MSQLWSKPAKITPMLEQYLEVKEQYPEALLFFRMGDFFEMFFEDAQLASEALDIALTSRNKADDEPIPMAGVPHHSYKSYVNRLVEQGFKVVICDQVEDARQAKGKRLVRREVVRVVTPGMVLDPDELDSRANSYLAAVFFARKGHGLALLDATTGEFRVTELPDAQLLAETQRVGPRELLLSQDQTGAPLVEEYISQLEGLSINYRDGSTFSLKEAQRRLCDHFRVTTLDGFGLDGLGPGLRAAGAILDYVQETQKADPAHIYRLTPYRLEQFMVLDGITRTNLEIFESLRDRTRKGSLFGLLDHSVTAMGGRKLKHWLSYPLLDRQRIERRLDGVEVLLHQATLRSALRDALRDVYDMERLNGKIASAQANARDLVFLQRSLQAVPRILKLLDSLEAPSPLDLLRKKIDPLSEVAEAIEKVLVEDPPVALKEGGLIREGYSEELDELRDIAAHGKDHILGMEAAERKSTGIQSLKIKYNKIFGYFIEVTKPNLHLVPDHYHRKQTMVNHERFITDDLKEFEEKILQAEERSLEMEFLLFDRLRQEVAQYASRISDLADRLAGIDVLSTLAEIASEYDYCRPTLADDTSLVIHDGRHPVVEKAMSAGQFVPNDLLMDPQESQFVLLTGPNMAGKSTAMRQMALIVLLAQVGSFVPAREATIGLCDRIFTRVGASDNLVAGQSTFMVEMTETSNILHNASERSLVLLDEIGRGTSTFDGISIAWAVTEYIHNRLRCRTLFATHYHELTALEQNHERFRNFNIAVKESNDEIVFLHKLLPGGSNRSYGIQVARLAGLPRSVISRAKKILRGLESGDLRVLAQDRPHLKDQTIQELQIRQLELFGPPTTSEPPPSPLQEELDQLDVNLLSPLDALQLLHEWKKEFGGENSSQ